MITENADHIFKILTIGESSVGKTCVLERFIDNKFKRNQRAFCGIDYRVKNIVMGSKTIKLKLWDTPGQERLQNIAKQFYKGADGIVLVFDVTDMNSFEKINRWMLDIHENTQIDKIGLVLLGNKADFEPKPVSTEMGSKLSQELGVKYFEVSALLNLNIEEAFTSLIEDIMNKKKVDLFDQRKEVNGSFFLSKPNGWQTKKGNGKNCF